ncbi:MAG: hypothetical protein ACLU9S_07845 [Oscillospiraceae bacterium]
MTISFSGLTFQIQLLYPGTERFFAGFLTDSPSYTACLRVTQEDLRQAACYCPADASPEFLETVALVSAFGGPVCFLMTVCLFHSAAMVFREQAYLFAAPSGTGKTTQLNLWRELYPEETTILNGDKPVLQFLDTGTIVVHASPWRGKESLGGTGSAPLGGIIYLRQSQADRWAPMPPGAAILPMLGQFFCTDRTEEHYRLLLPLLKRLVCATPIWLLENREGRNLPGFATTDY